MTASSSKISVRPFNKLDQEEAYRIWAAGMLDDLPTLFFNYFMAKKRTKLLFLAFLSISAYIRVEYIFIGILVDTGITAILYYWEGLVIFQASLLQLMFI